MDNSSTDLSFDAEQLAAALESVEFEESDVLAAAKDASPDNSAEVGLMPLRGQTQFSVNPVLYFKEGQPALWVAVFNNDHEPATPGNLPEFSTVLHAADGAEYMSYVDNEGSVVIHLPDIRALIGAKLELAKLEE